jgi:hypothetical protein
MPATIVVTLGGDEAVFGVTAVDRSALYGRRRRLALDDSGAPCSRASLLEDGTTLLRSGMTGQGYFLADGHWVAQADLEGLNPDGSRAEPVASTLGVAQPLTPASAEQLLDLSVYTVYALEPASLPDSMKSRLAAGEIFSFPFNYRADYRAETGMLLGNDDGLWALIGLPAMPEWQELTSITAVVDAAESDGDDDLDFEMF